MGLKDQARALIAQITTDTDNGWADDITLLSPGGISFDPTFDTTFGMSVSIKGLHSKHHLGIDLETGNHINEKKAHISFTEQQVVALGFPIRDASGEVNMARYLCKVKDSTGVLSLYVVEQWFPDETVGLIVCILGDYAP